MQQSSLPGFIEKRYQQQKGAKREDYPFWDFRCLRRETWLEKPAMPTSILKKGNRVRSSPTQSVRWEQTSDTESIPCSDADSGFHGDEPNAISLILNLPSERVRQLSSAYSALLRWIDPKSKLLTVNSVQTKGDECVNMPTLAIMYFLKESEMTGGTRLAKANTTFLDKPWSYHHSDSVSRGRIRVYAENAQDYYSTTGALPLCAARQVHSGSEHIRLVRFVSYANWEDTCRLYRLIISQEPDVTKEDFCLYTMCQYPTYDVQFALKRLPQTVKLTTSEHTALQFRVSDIGQLVPLLPNVCTQIGDVRWQTRDLDGNLLVLHVCDSSLQDSFSSMSSREDGSTSLDSSASSISSKDSGKVDLNQGFFI